MLSIDYHCCGYGQYYPAVSGITMSTDLPLVTILTPVYNGEKYLAACIRSVLNQQYENWEYIIVNNCSTDSTLDIALGYAQIDPRIRIVTNSKFVEVIENHNIAFSLVSTESKYCKVVSADDTITPDCLIKMVKLAEAHPTVAIVGSYQLSGTDVRWKGIPPDVQVVPGRALGRLSLLGNLDVFGTPTSLLYRADLIRESKPFFPHTLPHADTSTCYEILQRHDFGFVHEILCTERVHEYQVSAKVRQLNMGETANLDMILRYGPYYLDSNEFEILKDNTLRRYYRWLGGSLLKLKELKFWKYHTARLKELGYPLPWREIIEGAVHEIIDEIHNPRLAFRKLSIAVESKR
jgi:glycosyltransferase involved in cell wall biosynthesis